LAQSKVKAATIQIASFGSALDLYDFDVGQYPTSSQGLRALMQRPGNLANWNGPYLKGDVVPKDPWGHDYMYRSPGEHGPYDIVSLGPEGRDVGTETASAVTSWAR
jgi:general secretion pathway protein G